MRQPESPFDRGAEEIASDGQALAATLSACERTCRSRQEGGTDLARRVAGTSLITVLRFAPMVRLSLHSRVQPLRPEDQYPKLLAEFSTEPADGEIVQGRWTRLRITQTAAGEYLCEKTRGPEPVEERSAVVNNFNSAKAFFGGGWVVKELFAKLDPVRFPRWP